MAFNPFSGAAAGGPPADGDDAAVSRFAIAYACEALWSLFGELPNKAEATLAQRRLEEAAFWARRANGDLL